MSHPPATQVARRLLAEYLGTALLVAIVVGSGIAAQQLSPDDVGLQLLQNSTATVPGLTILILMFGPISGAHFNPAFSLADWYLGRRDGHGHGLALVFALARTGRATLSAPAVGGYIGAAYWFTSSTSFATPAVTVGRIFSDTFAGITPGSAWWFIGARLVGMAVGLAITVVLYPDAGAHADDVVVPHPTDSVDTPTTLS